MAKTRKPERFLLRVVKGALEPMDEATKERLRVKGYRVGDILSAELRKARNPGFHRLMHAFGAIVADNVEAFEGLPAHATLKRLQIETGVGCDEISVNFPGIGPCSYRTPRSLSYESMDDGEASEVFAAMARYVAKKYWPGMTEDQIRQMAELMG